VLNHHSASAEGPQQMKSEGDDASVIYKYGMVLNTYKYLQYIVAICEQSVQRVDQVVFAQSQSTPHVFRHRVFSVTQ
jgi:hypothetical protein